MDTRTKILPIETLPAVLQTGNWTVIEGLFDPLTAVQARRLAGLTNNGRKLMAVVLDSNDALLSSQARAVLVAALREVSAVAIADSRDWPSLVPQNSSVELIEDLESERASTAEFIQFVLKRQNA